jgi:DNA invertase Pin-like site-specific DNA recombinase
VIGAGLTLPRAGLYVRVSTSEQSTDGQVAALEGFAHRLGWPIPCVYRDDGISGVLDNRPALDLLRADVRAGNVQAVLATKLDRLGRSVLGVQRFFEEVEGAGCRVIVTEQGYDTAASSPSGRLLRNVLADLAEFERELILERTRAGVSRARSRGVRFGRKPKALDKDRLERVRSLRAGGASIRRIAQVVGLPKSRVERLLRAHRPKYPPLEQGLSVREEPGGVPQGPSSGTPPSRRSSTSLPVTGGVYTSDRES